ncbi:hypothetical protein D3C76_1696860 [compost metagenome]
MGIVCKPERNNMAERLENGAANALFGSLDLLVDLSGRRVCPQFAQGNVMENILKGREHVRG